MIVPVKGRWAALQQFVRRFRASRPLERNLHLVVACFGSAKEVSFSLMRGFGRTGKQLVPEVL